jgi:hypothetical protein
MTAVRDSATVDYAFFFLVAYRLGSMPRARRVLERCLVAAFLILPVVVLVSIFIPDKLMSIRLRGYPVIFHKYDLTTAYLSFASIYFFLAALDGKRRMIRLVLSVAYLCLMLMIVTRAAIFGFGCATLLLIAARQFRFLFVQALMVLIAATTIATLQVTNTGGQSFLAPLADKVESMTDFSGQGRSYRGEFGEVAADNNQFRLVWWRAVIDETVAKGPIFGLGFGYDLASNFVREYYGTYYRDFETRSPHSIWVTIFGRMGLIGLLVFIAFAFIFVRDAFRVALQVRAGRAPPIALVHWCGAAILLGSSSFGVVLEGPMGAVVFWTLLGLAASTPVPQAEPVEPKRLEPARAPISFRRRPQPTLAGAR